METKLILRKEYRFEEKNRVQYDADLLILTIKMLTNHSRYQVEVFSDLSLRDYHKLLFENMENYKELEDKFDYLVNMCDRTDRYRKAHDNQVVSDHYKDLFFILRIRCEEIALKYGLVLKIIDDSGELEFNEDYREDEE